MYIWYVDTEGLNVRDFDHLFSLIAIRFFPHSVTGSDESGLYHVKV